MKRNFTPRIGPLALAAAVLLGSTGAFTGVQAQSLDELERRIQEKKEAKAKREAEAAKAEAGRRAQESRMATLVVQSDAPCALSVNGDQVAQVGAGISKVKIGPGQKLVSCQSSEESGAVFEGQVEARSGQDSVLRIQLLDRLEPARQEREAKAACAGGARHVMVSGRTTGVLKQCGTGLEWTQSDNGTDISWSEAESYCRNKGAGWSLPTVEQLQFLYEAQLPEVSCGHFSCKVSNQFRLGKNWFWSSERNGSSEAWLVGLFAGHRVSYRLGDRLDCRALCVRRP